jgi:hypothetical protein
MTRARRAAIPIVIGTRRPAICRSGRARVILPTIPASRVSRANNCVRDCRRASMLPSGPKRTESTAAFLTCSPIRRRSESNSASSFDKLRVRTFVVVARAAAVDHPPSIADASGGEFAARSGCSGWKAAAAFCALALSSALICESSASRRVFDSASPCAAAMEYHL